VLVDALGIVRLRTIRNCEQRDWILCPDPPDVSFELFLPGANPRRLVPLGNLGICVPKQCRHTIERHTGE